jgi:energy-coupling factor transport system ATP-binding protein
VLRLLAGLRAEGLALVVIEHDAGAAALADQLVLFEGGRITAAGPPAAILADVDRCVRAGIRPTDTGRVFAALGLGAPPLGVDAAAETLRAAGFRARPVSGEKTPARHAATLIILDRVTHRWADGRVALDDVSLTIGRGESIALVGHNGAGKTTLAKHLNGLLAPTRGSVRLEGAEVTRLPLEELAQRVGFVFQDPDHQLFASTVVDEVAFGPRNVGLDEPAVAERVAEALAAVGLESRTADPFLLDKGARQRLAVASVLALRPDVLVLDEPMTGLDHAEQQRMLTLLRALHQRGQTILMITHTPWVIAEYAERVVLLAAGRVRYDGAVRPFFADAALVTAAAFHAPEVTRLGAAFGQTPLTVEELVGLLRPPGSR